MSKEKTKSMGTVGTEYGRFVEVRKLIGREITNIETLAAVADEMRDSVVEISGHGTVRDWVARIFTTPAGMVLEIYNCVNDDGKRREIIEKLVNAGYRRR